MKLYTLDSTQLIQKPVEEVFNFFSKPENFAHYGSAEQYYLNSIKRIHNTYPYDGSLKAGGIKLFINGQQVETTIKNDNLYKLFSRLQNKLLIKQSIN